MSQSSRDENPGCLAALADLLFGPVRSGGRRRFPPKELPYRLRDDFLSLAEKSFYHVLTSMLGKNFVVFAQVSLGELFFINKRRRYYYHLSRINQKRVDFVICDSRSLIPRFAVELDDRSHSSQKRKIRDAFVDKVFQAARLPLVHIPAQRAYDTHQLAEIFKTALPAGKAIEPQPDAVSAPVPSPVPTPAPAPDSGQIPPPAVTPVCPKCGIPMLLRVVRNGPHIGKKFYGCANYPRCRELIPIEKVTA